MDSPTWIGLLATAGILGTYLLLAQIVSQRQSADRLDREAYTRARRRFVWACLAIAGILPLRALLSSSLHSISEASPGVESLLRRMSDAPHDGLVLLFWLLVVPGSALASVAGFGRSSAGGDARVVRSMGSRRRSAGLVRRARMSRQSWILASVGLLGNVLFLVWAATALEGVSGELNPASKGALLNGAYYVLDLALLLALHSVFSDPELAEFLAEPLPPGGSPELEARYTRARLIREGSGFQILLACSAAGWVWIGTHVLGDPTSDLENGLLIGLVLACLAHATYLAYRSGKLEAANRRTFRELSHSPQGLG